MNIDRQRIAAVQALEEAGWIWDGAHWHPAESSPNGNLRGAMAVLVALHTEPDAEVGFRVAGLPMWGSNAYSVDAYTEAWGVVRRHLGLPSEPA